MKLTPGLKLIDRLRKWLLVASLALVVIPGFVGLDLNLFGARLGRFQPFKFAFFPWLACQAVWVFRRVPLRPLLRSLGGAQLLWAFVAVLDLFLAVGLLVEGGSDRGWSIYAALLMGQFAALISVLDDEFPVDAMVRGTYGATFILVFFSVLELAFPTSDVTVAFLRLVRDTPVVLYQLGSSLTVSALAEYTVRALPLIVLLSDRSWLAAFCSASLVAMGFLTLEKSATLSLGVIAFVLFLSGFGRKYLKSFLVLAVLSFIALIVIRGPDRVIGRYIGMFSSINATDDINVAARHSMNERFTLMGVAIHSIEEKPLTGAGLGGLIRQKSKFTTPENKRYLTAEHTHNLILEMGVCGGIFALFAFVGSFLLYGSLAWRSSPRRWTALLYFAGQTVSILVDARIYVSWLAITLFWFAGMAWAADRARTARPKRPVTA